MKHKKPNKNEIESLISGYSSPNSKKEVSSSWTKYLLVTHPVEFITSVGRVNGKLKTNIAPFATCLDTSYHPSYVTFAIALKQHAIQGQPQTNSRMNTYLNIRQNNLFIVNVPDKSLLSILDIVAYPYQRRDLEDKIMKARLTKLNPFVLSRYYKIYPPLIDECLAHLECEVVDIHRPKGSDHYLITGKVVGASYDKKLGDNIDEIRNSLIKRVFHHFGASSDDPSLRYIGYVTPDVINTITFKLEEKNKEG